MEYSVKNIEKILIAASLNENTKSKYIYLDNTDDNRIIIENIQKELLSPEYSQAVEAYKNGHMIFRGQKRQEEHLAAVVTPGTRKSQDNANVYTKLMSEILPSWKEYPRRDKAVICSNNYEYAKKFSETAPFIIFPQNNTKIGLCPRYDIWVSFSRIQEKNCYRLNSFGEFLIDFISIILNIERDIVENLFLRDKNTILEVFREVNIKSRQLYQKIRNTEISNPFKNKHEILQYLFNNIGSGNFNLINILDEYLMNPYENNFRLVDIDDIPRDGNQEMWFEGQHLMIHFNSVGRVIIEEIIKNKA